MLGLERLVDRLQRDYARVSFDEARFPELATRALAEVPPIDDFDFDQLTAWMTDPASSMAHDDVVNTFGDVRATIARGTGFNVQLLVWAVGSTDMHTHSFSGAFTVLRGSSLHTVYRVETLERLSVGASRVRCAVESSEWLRPGRPCPIASGAGFVHSIFHLDEPTLSLVVRTDHEPWASPPLIVLPPHYAVSPEWLRRDGRVPMLGKVFRAMHKLGDPKLLDTFVRRLRELDFPRGSVLLRSNLDLFDGPALAVIAEQMVAIHGPVADGWPDVIQRHARTERGRAVRAHVPEPEARKLLAAMMLAEDRAHARAMLELLSLDEGAIERWGHEIPALAKLWVTIPR